MTLLLDRANTDERNAINPNILLSAASNGSLEGVKVLLDHGIKPVAFSADTSALTETLMRGHREIATLLLEHDAPLDSRDAEGYTPLLTAYGLGWADVAKAMLARGADPNIRTKAGLTAVDLAIAANSPETVSLLISKGATDRPAPIPPERYICIVEPNGK